MFNNDGQRAWTITGPYGTGKSSFAAFLAAVLAGKDHPANSVMLAALESVAPKAVTQLRANLRQHGRLIPVLVTGSQEPFGTLISKACVAAISQYCTSAEAKRLRARVSTAIAERSDLDPVEVVSNMHNMVVKHEPKTVGTIIIVDELGKVLEFAARHPDKTDVYALQQIAEMASTSSSSLNLIGVLHQDFAAYGRDLAPEERLEWEKIRGRFEDILFDEPADQMLRMLARSIQSDGPLKEAQRHWNDAVAAITNANVLPPGLPRSECVTLLKQCWPLHPLTAIVLGSVFKRYGQNERSAFTFVQSREPFSLRDFADRHQGQMYTLDSLFDYLTCTYGDALIANRDGKHWAEAIDVDRRISDSEASQIRAFRTTALLGIIGRWNDLGPTPKLVQAALAPMLSSDEVAHAIEALRNRSLLVLRKFNNTLALWEGSDVDIEGRLSLAQATLHREIATASELSRHVRVRSMIARRHSFETGTLRVLPVNFVEWDAAIPPQVAPVRGDAHINVILRPKGESHGSTLPAIISHAGPFALFVIPTNSREILALAHGLACIDWVRRNTPELAGDATARRELDAREIELRRKLATEQAAMMFGENGETAARWYRNGKPVRVRDARDLNDLLSTMCDQLYPAAPIIRNEIINRSELSSSAAAARRNLIEMMIKHTSMEGLGITGNPPERSIYLSVLRELGLHRASRDGYYFSADPQHAPNNGGPVLEGIRQFFRKAEAERHTVAELFALLQAPPFGIRAGVLPVILCAVLLASESEIALYEDGAFIPQLTIEVFERLMKTPSLFSIRRWTVTGVRATIFGQMADVLGEKNEVRAGRDQVLDVVKPMLRFFRRLDQYSQTSRYHTPQTMLVRNALASATEPDQLLFVELPRACGIEPFYNSANGRDGDAQLYVTRLKDSLAELQRCYDTLLASLQVAIADAFGLSQDLSALRQGLIKRARAVEPVSVDPELKAFVRRLDDNGVEDRQWLESLASLLAGRPTTMWRDDDRAKFDVTLSNRVRRIQSLEAMLRQEEIASANGEHMVRVAVAGSTLKDHEVVVRLSREQVAASVALTDQLRTFLGSAKLSRHRNVVLATLASLIEETVGEPQQSRNGATI